MKLTGFCKHGHEHQVLKKLLRISGIAEGLAERTRQLQLVTL